MKTSKRYRSASLLLPFRRRAWLAVVLATHHLTSTTITYALSTPSFAQFRFAPNGICRSPRYFQDASTGDTFLMRNVPGDGDCMFLAATTGMLHGIGLNLVDTKESNHDNTIFQTMAQQTRATVSRILQSTNGTLVIDAKQRSVSAQALLATAVREDAIDGIPVSKHEYLKHLETPGGLYGGGPELTVLANLFRRPISVYELCHSSLPSDNHYDEDSSATTTTTTTLTICPIECKGTFGEGVFVDPLDAITSAVWNPAPTATGGGDSISTTVLSWTVHILVIDVSLHEKHACVLIPVQTNKPRRGR